MQFRYFLHRERRDRVHPGTWTIPFEMTNAWRPIGGAAFAILRVCAFQNAASERPLSNIIKKPWSALDCRTMAITMSAQAFVIGVSSAIIM